MGIIIKRRKDVMEQETIQRLFMQHYAKMIRVARNLLFDEQECEDVVSDIFEGLLRGQTVIMPETEERYLLTSVRNQCLKQLRHEAIKRVSDAPLTTAAIDTPDTEEDRVTDIVEFVVSHLSEQNQRIFNLRFTQGYSYEEIAYEEGISRVAVWKHLSHIITEIKKHYRSL